MKHHIVRRAAVSLATQGGRFTLARLLALAASGAAVLAFASVALASSGAKGVGGVSSVRGALAVSATETSDAAGWLDNFGDKAQRGVTISATIVLPKLKCGRTQQAIGPQVMGALGLRFGSAGEFVGCYDGKAHYFPVLDGGGTAKLAAHAGDRVVLRVSMTSARTVVSVVDKTTRHASKRLTSPGSAGKGACFVEDSGVTNGSTGRQEGVPNFGKLTFSHAVLDGRPLGAASTLVKEDMARGSTLQIKTSPFTNHGETFETIFKHS